MRNVIALIGFNRTTDSNKIEVIVLDDQKSRELRRIQTGDGSGCLFVRLYDIVDVHANAAWRNEERIAEKQKERYHTRLGSSAVFNIAFERE